VLNPVDYTKIVALIKDEIDLGKVDLSQILNGHQMMAVIVAASSTTGQPLNSENSSKIAILCDEIFRLDTYRSKVRF